MIEFDITQAMVAHKTTLINTASDTYNPTMTGVLPHGDISTIG
jgi:hypothetical protein